MAGTEQRGNRTPVPWLALLFLFIAATNVVWLHLDTLPPSWDQSAHARFALEYLRFFEHPVAKWNSRDFLTISGYWPPFVYWTTVPLSALLGFSFDSLALVNLFYLLVLVASLYGLGKRLAGRAVGLGAAAMTLFIPIVYVLSREILLDFPLLASVAAAQLTILVTAGGLDRKRSWLMGLAVGIALLIKWTAVVFLIPTWLFVVIWSWINRKDLRRQAFAGLAISLATALAVAGPWYFTVRESILKGAQTAIFRDSALEGDPTSFWASIRWYAITFCGFIVVPLMAPFLAAGIAAAAAFFRKAFTWGFLLAWIVPSWLFFIILPNKDGRFIAPLVPAVILLVTAGVSAFPGKTARRVFWGSFFACALFVFSCLSFAWPIRIQHVLGHPPVAEDWQAERILADLEAEFPAPRPAISVLANVRFFNPNILKLYAEMRRDGFTVESVGDERGIGARIRLHPVMITKTGSISVEHAQRYRRSFQKDFDRRGPGSFGFRLFAAYPLPDGSEARVYVRLPPPPRPPAGPGKKGGPSSLTRRAAPN